MNREDVTALCVMAAVCIVSVSLLCWIFIKLVFG
jgi:hypothetical protein